MRLFRNRLPILLIVLIPNTVIALEENVCQTTQQQSSSYENGSCSSRDSAQQRRDDLPQPKVVGDLRPWHLPQPVAFSDFHKNTTVSLSSTTGMDLLDVAIGRVTQINRIDHQPSASYDGDDDSYGTEFSVIPGAVSRPSIQKLLQLLEAYPFYDDDPDTVDGMPTYEIFVDTPDLGNPSMKFRDSDPNFVPQRTELRQQLQSILLPYLNTVITPYVRETYPEACMSKGQDRLCTPCYSLIRRYRHGERQSHATHHDGHAIVTVVVSLSDYNVDYRGGLYVSTGYGQREFMALNKGDAVVHQSNLLHGVKVMDLHDHPEQTKRWSWILWYKDSTQCQDYSHEWFSDCAAQGNPLCQQLHSTKVGNIPGISQSQTAQQVLELNVKAAQGGAGMAAVKVARAYLHQLPSSLPFSLQEAQKYFEMAIASHNPDGHYGMAQLLLQQVSIDQQQQLQRITAQNAWNDTRVTTAVQHLESAAWMDHAYSIFNLGMVHTYGYSTGIVNGTLAAEWFVASGLPEGYYLAAQQAKAIGNQERYDYCAKRAQVLGFTAMWRKEARDATGSGGASGVSLNLPWPLAMDGRKPPQL